MTESKREDKKTLINGHRAPNNEKNIISIKKCDAQKSMGNFNGKVLSKVAKPSFSQIISKKVQEKKRKKKSQNADY